MKFRFNKFFFHFTCVGRNEEEEEEEEDDKLEGQAESSD